ncbi:MAG: hypothetical protein ABIQ59_08435 [Nocardioidaceae bacterium]
MTDAPTPAQVVARVATTFDTVADDYDQSGVAFFAPSRTGSWTCSTSGPASGFSMSGAAGVPSPSRPRRPSETPGR